MIATDAPSAPSEHIDRAAGALGSLVQRDVPLAPFTTFRVGGRAALFAEITDGHQLEVVAETVRRFDLPVLCIGQGSNLLISDDGFGGLALVLGGEFATIAIEGTTVRSGGAVKLPVLARRTAASSLSGLEWAVGVPGSVGGAVAMNAGGHGSDVRATLLSATVVDLAVGHERVVPAEALDLGYRTSALGPSHVVVSAEFGLVRGNRLESEREIAEIVRWRREHQPGGANCGSVFTNPPGDSAGRIIDAAGLRGLRLGSASVSEKHANFIQADDRARAADVWALIQLVRTTVLERTGIDLRAEVRTVGFPPPGSAHDGGAGAAGGAP